MPTPSANKANYTGEYPSEFPMVTSKLLPDKRDPTVPALNRVIDRSEYPQLEDIPSEEITHPQHILSDEAHEEMRRDEDSWWHEFAAQRGKPRDEWGLTPQQEEEIKEEARQAMQEDNWYDFLPGLGGPDEIPEQEDMFPYEEIEEDPDFTGVETVDWWQDIIPQWLRQFPPYTAQDHRGDKAIGSDPADTYGVGKTDNPNPERKAHIDRYWVPKRYAAPDYWKNLEDDYAGGWF